MTGETNYGRVYAQLTFMNQDSQNISDEDTGRESLEATQDDTKEQSTRNDLL